MANCSRESRRQVYTREALMREPDTQVTRDNPLLRIESTEQDDALVVALAGEFDLASAQLVDEELGRAQESYPVVVLDLSQVTFMDSTGLHVVLVVDERMREAGSTLRVVPGSPQVQRLFELTGATQRLETVTDSSPAGASERA
jgi:anti-anti-sigma factor